MRKKVHQVIIGGEVMLLCMVVALLSTQAASANPPSNGVSYNKNGQVTVENALDNLYSKVNYGDAKANEILKGKKALVGGKEVVGTFTCPTLASLTPGDAIPEDITDGKIAWVNGEKVIGTYISPTSMELSTFTVANYVNIGDYISYTPSKNSYKISKDDTEYKWDQTIDPSELKLWRAIRMNLDGTVELVSEYVSKNWIQIGGEGVYKKYIGVLNKIAHAYETEGITVGSRAMGYDSTTAQEYVTSSNAGDDGYKVDENLVRIAIGGLKVKDVYGYPKNYLLASRAEKSPDIREVSAGGFVDEYFISENVGRIIRPIIILKSTTKLTGGNGTEASPYTLGV